MAFDHRIRRRRYIGDPTDRCGECEADAIFTCMCRYFRGGSVLRRDRLLCRKHALMFATSNEIAVLPKKSGDVAKPPREVNAARERESIEASMK